MSILDDLLARAAQGLVHAANRRMGIDASLIAGAGVNAERKLKTHYTVECIGADGEVKWVEEFENLVVNVGLDDSLDKHLKGSAYTAAWYVGLTGATPVPAAGDTMASHGGWTESAIYSEANRPTLTLGTVSGQSVDNSASKASFSINAGGTIGGAFVVDNSTKSGSTGTLYGVGAFTGGNRTVANGDTLNVTVTCTAAAS